jgi:hypothetical protein
MISYRDRASYADVWRFIAGVHHAEAIDAVGVIPDSMLGVVLMSACGLLTVLLQSRDRFSGGLARFVEVVYMVSISHAANTLRIRGVDQVL